MSSHFIIDAEGKCRGVITVANIYKFQGVVFEMHHYCGPCKLKKDGEPAARMGRKFWAVWKAWDALTPEEKLATQING